MTIVSFVHTHWSRLNTNEWIWMNSIHFNVDFNHWNAAFPTKVNLTGATSNEWWKRQETRPHMNRITPGKFQFFVFFTLWIIWNSGERNSYKFSNSANFFPRNFEKSWDFCFILFEEFDWRLCGTCDIINRENSFPNYSQSQVHFVELKN